MRALARHKKIHFFLLIICLVLLSSCAELVQRLAILNCKYAFEDIAAVNIGLSALDIKLSIRIDNPNPSNVILDRLGFEFFINDGRIFQGVMGNRLEVPAKGSSVLDHIIRISYLEVGMAVIQAIKEKSATYRLTGTAHFDTPLGQFSFPVDIARGKVY